ncbi:MAG: hypothetical protein MK479_03180 [Planctomycetes bacterium]|nr:hypothetical protein [Planctomycetota bacterium]
MSLPSDGEREALNLDEEPLKDWILKAYHEKALDSEEHARLVDAERLLLSGPNAHYNSARYYFEADPGPRLEAFARQLDEVSENLAADIFEPIELGLKQSEPSLKTPEERPRGRANAASATNLSLYIASLAGPIAMRAGIDETVACSLLSTVLLAISRVGITPVREALG